ncbi:WLM domain-containing protein [Exophiala viscosa]|uniref:WLM domain-containing protein n=1 Tax=Exophiala viscosa TaxID=2486360 RepID=A0AAN6E5L0_9EURO|nr:WLM domain-containing protein [Exophiala viscosa]KAI1627644.1 WLM domain-containing protein [Exophiala viscosa]
MSRTLPTEMDPLVDQFQHLTDKRRGSEALQMLQKIASIVKPLMRQRNWRVGVLAEFYPHERNLLGLNINRGEKICLRLRYPGDDTQFLPFENIVDTMLHELAHIIHGPHDQVFHALWDKLRDEHEALLRKGYTGEGFLGKGNRVGGRRVPLSEIHRQARAAAERRRDLTKGSGQRLGGQGIIRGQNAREIIAAAAERRLRIERGCASATEHGRQIAHEEAIKTDKVTITKAEKQDEEDAALMQAYIDMIQEEEQQLFGKDYVPPSQENPAGVRGTAAAAKPLREQQLQIERELQQARSQKAPSPQVPRPSPSPSIPSKRPAAPAPAPVQETWTCEICTLINPLQHLMCGACETERPSMYSDLSLYLDGDGPPVPRHIRPGPKNASSTPRQTPAALQPRLSSADALAKFESEAMAKAQVKPLGWTCGGCNTWMESQWWTCSRCGRMKTTS